MIKYSHDSTSYHWLIRHSLTRLHSPGWHSLQAESDVCSSWIILSSYPGCPFLILWRSFWCAKYSVAIAEELFWLSIWKQVEDYIRRCSHCNQSKPANKKIGLYQCLLVSCRDGEFIPMDFTSSLPTTKWKHDCIFVVVCRISKMTVFISCNKTTVAFTTAILFFQLIWSHFGSPLTIIFDYESSLLSYLWKSLRSF